MEEKKAKISNSFRAFSGSKFLNRSFFSASVKPTIFTSVKLKSKGFIQHHFKKNQPFNANTGGAGFTLVEILIVVAVVGILAAGFITILNPADQLRGARDSKRKSNLQQIRTALELYRADCSVYPASPLGNSISSSCTGSSIIYLQSVPRDPKTNLPYTYSRTSNSSYQLIACLERISDPEGSGACAGGSGRNYTVTNP